MTKAQSLTDITTRVLTGMERALAEVRPDIVLVHGDTTTSTAAALAAFYQKIPVGHVEAGLRTSTIAEPFPEEANRRITGVLASFHFAPTARAKSQPARRTHRSRARRRHRQHRHRRLSRHRAARARTGSRDAGARRPRPRPAARSSSPRTAARTTAQMGEIARAIGDDRRISRAAADPVAGPPLAAGQPGRARGARWGRGRPARRAARLRADRRRGRCVALRADRLGRASGRSADAGQAGAGHAARDGAARGPGSRDAAARSAQSTPTSSRRRTGC